MDAVSPQTGAANLDIDHIFEEVLDYFGARRRYHVQWNHLMSTRLDDEFWEIARLRLSASRYAE